MKKLLGAGIMLAIMSTTAMGAPAEARTISVADVAVDEESGFVNVTVSIFQKIGATGMTISFDWTTNNGVATATYDSAKSGTDYTALSGTGTFVKNANTVVLKIPILDDVVPEKDEQFYVELSNITIANPGNIADTAVITDGLSVVTIRDTDIAENETPILYIQNETAKENVGIMQMTVRTTVLLTEDLFFDYSISLDSSPTAISASSTDLEVGTGRGVILAGQYSTTIPVTIKDDSIPEGTKSFPVLISNASNPDVVFGDYISYFPYARGTIEDNDDILSIYIQDSQIFEGNANSIVKTAITLSQPLDYNLSIDILTKDATLANNNLEATEGVDYTGFSVKTIIFPAGTTEYIIETGIIGDTLSEEDESFLIFMEKVAHEDGTLATEIEVAKDTSKVTILDDDTPSACSKYRGLVTINEVQNNPKYKDDTHPLSDGSGMVQGQFVEIKYIDFLVKQHITKDWTIEIIGQNKAMKYQWSMVSDGCGDPRYDIFFFDSQYMGSTETLVILRDAQGNRVDEFNLNNKVDVEGAALNCPYDYDTRIVDGVGETAADKDYYRDPDGTGEWDRTGNGSNSGGSQCVNKDSEGLIFTKFDAIDTDEVIPNPVFNAGSVPLKTKEANTPFDENIVSINVDNGALMDIDTTIKVYLADENGEKLIGNNPPVEVNFANQSVSFAGGFVYPNALRRTRLYFEYCLKGSWSDCFGTADSLDARRKSNSRNLYAIRPSALSFGFGAGIDSKLLKAGKNYPFSIEAQDTLGSTVNGYTINTFDYLPSLFVDNDNLVRYLHDNAGDIVPDTAGTLEGAATLDTSIPGYMYNGRSKIVSSDTSAVTAVIGGLKYSDVGRISVPVQDREWAAIDSDDTPADCTSPYHRWICGELSGTFIPDHFTISKLKVGGHAIGANAVYIANDREDMSAKISATIESRNADEGVTVNFRQGDYEYPISATLTVKAADAGVDSYLYPEGNETKITETEIGFGETGPNADANGKRTIALDEATYPLVFNFKRVINETANPFRIDGSRVALGVTAEYTGNLGTTQVKGSRIGDSGDVEVCSPASDPTCIQENAEGEAIFYFARAKSSRLLYEAVGVPSINTPIGVDVFCDGVLVNCADYNMTAITTDRTDSKDWYQWIPHKDSQGYGNIVGKVQEVLIEGSGINAATMEGEHYSSFADIAVENNGVNGAIVVDKQGMANPVTTGIEYVVESDGLGAFTDEWLIYNPDANSVPSPFYKVRFRDGTGWNGVGKVGSVVDANISTRKTKKMFW